MLGCPPLRDGLGAAVTVETAAQVHALERTVVGLRPSVSSRALPTPQQLPGQWLGADRLPLTTQLITTDGKRLITVTTDWHSPGERSAAAAVARTNCE